MRLRHLITAGLVGSAVLVSHGQARVEWLSTAHDFGAFDESLETVTCEFVGVNRGNEPLQILDVRSTCGCTTPRYSTQEVAPGDTLRIGVGYKATGRPGRFSKKVKVRTNGEPSRSELTISGTVIGTGNTLKSRYPVSVGEHVRLRTADFIFGTVGKKDVKGLYIEGYNASSSPLKPQIKGLPGYLSVIVEPEEVPAGDTFVLSGTFDADMCSKWDVVSDTFTFESGDGSSVEMSSTAIIEEDFSQLTPEERRDAPEIKVSERVMDAGRIDAGSNKELKFSVKIENRGRNELILRRIYTADPAVKLKLKGGNRVKSGKSVTLEVRVDVKDIADYDMLNDRIIIVSNDPGNARTVLRLVGEIVDKT